MGFGPSSNATKSFLGWLVMAIKNGSFIIGVLALLLVDLVLGASFYGSAVGDSTGFTLLGYHVSGTQFGWGVSIATTAMQIMVWDFLESHGRSIRSAMTSVGSAAAIIAILALTVIDTIADLGALTQSIYPDTSTLQLLPENPQPGYWVVAMVVMIMTVFNEPILGFFVLNGKKRAVPVFGD